jgi:adenylylsulfate kinase
MTMPRAPGFILWFTGLSGAGKSTLSRAVAARLQQPTQILDGDEVRTFLCRGLGFSKADRDENVRRIGYVARLLAGHGVAALTAAISPYRAARDEVRQLAGEAQIPFVEAYLEAKLEALAARDVKGLYKRALAGEIEHFTGVSDPYEPPVAPELLLRTDVESVEESVERIVRALRDRRLFP